MELSTVARDNTAWEMPLYVAMDDGLALEQGLGARYRFYLIEEGTGIFRFADRRFAFVAPAFLVLDEVDVPQIERVTDIKAHGLYFAPSVINSTFCFDNIRQEDYGFDLSAYQDRFWLKPFFVRDSNNSGLFNVGPATFRRALQIVENLHEQLREQNASWPCRSRSFLLELLFLLERVHSSPEAKEEIALPESHTEMDPVILYLHTHYQEKITISELTRVFHINRTTLMERFFGATGMTIMAYLINLRVRLASMMLRDTLLPISEIMERVGFNDITHFGRTFRQHTGMTPSDYRQKFCWM